MDRVARFRLLNLAVPVLLACAFLPGASRAAEAPRMTAAELKAALGNAELAVVDVRVDASVAETRIPGAAIEDPGNVEAWAPNYPKGKTLVLYCS